MVAGIFRVTGVVVVSNTNGDEGEVYVRTSLNSPVYGDSSFLTEIDRAPAVGSWITLVWE